MKYEEFIAIVREKAQERLGEAYKVMVEKHMTNNGMLVDALCLNRAEEPPSPSLYLNTYFDLYQESMSLDDIMDEILEVYEWEEARKLSIREEWKDYGTVKKMIGMKLVNTEKNKILLGEIVNIHFLDLSVLFFICRKEKEALLTTLITHEYMEMWGVTEKDLWEAAQENTAALLPAKIRDIKEILHEAARVRMGKSYSKETVDEVLNQSSNKGPMYVLTNETGYFGASCLLYHDVLDDFADRLGTNLYILPVSIHEVVLIPIDSNLEYESLPEIIKAVNHTEVLKEDFLSDSLYYYSREKRGIFIAEVGREGTAD